MLKDEGKGTDEAVAALSLMGKILRPPYPQKP